MFLRPLLFYLSFRALLLQLGFANLVSYIIGDVVKETALSIGFFLFAMGIAAFLFEKIEEENYFEYLFWINLTSNLIIIFIPIIFISSAVVFNSYMTFKVVLVAFLLGFLTGFELPIVMGIINSNNITVKSNISMSFFWDYLGALFGAISIIYLIPALGYNKLFSILSIISILIMVYFMEVNRKLDLKKIIVSILVFIFAVFLMLNGNKILENLIQTRYGKTIYKTTSMIQEIRFSQFGEKEKRLYLNYSLQFSYKDIDIYHDLIAKLPYSYLKEKNKNNPNVLIIGGGDLLAASKILHSDKKADITLIEIDKKMIEATKFWAEKLEKNIKDKIKIIIADAFSYIMQGHIKKKFDLIILDLPDPKNWQLAKLYSLEFFNALNLLLSQKGILVLQTGSIYYNTKSFFCSYKTLSKIFKDLFIVNFWMDSLKEWAFIYSGNDLEDFKRFLKVNLKKSKYAKNISFYIPADCKENIGNLSINTLDKPIIVKYYRDREG